MDSQEIVVSDNGPSFTSEKFQQFMRRNGVHHVKCALYHPASNGLAEKAVQTFKEGLKKTTQEDIATCLSHFLFQNRLTPHTTTGIALAELPLGRRPHSHLDLLHPQLDSRVLTKQNHQKLDHDWCCQDRQLVTDDLVYVRDFSNGLKWMPGVVTAALGPVSYTVTLMDNWVVRRHVDHVRKWLDSDDQKVDDDWLPQATSPDPLSTSITIPAPSVETHRSSHVRAAPDHFDPSAY